MHGVFPHFFWVASPPRSNPHGTWGPSSDFRSGVPGQRVQAGRAQGIPRGSTLAAMEWVLIIIVSLLFGAVGQAIVKSRW